MESGLRGGPAILLVTVGLSGLFFGKAQARGALVVGGVSVAFAGYAELRVRWAPHFGTPGDLVNEWTTHIVFFAFMGTMLALTLAAALARVRQASTRARQFALAAEHADRAMFVLDGAGAVSWVNEAFVRTTGISQADAVGQTLDTLLAGPATDPAAFDRLRSKRADPAARGGAASRVEIVPGARGAEPLWASVEVRAMGDTPGCSGLILDVTEARAVAELERVQRALSTGLSSAARPGEASLALARALLRASAVRGVRVLRHVADGAVEVVHEVFRPATQGRVWGVATVSAAASGDGSHPPDAHGDPGLSEADDATAMPRAQFPMEGDTPGVLEVVFAAHVPGRAALALRVPELVKQLVRHERRLAEQARFEALFDCSPDALVLVDVRGKLMRCNAVAAALWPALDRAEEPAWPADLGAAIAEATGVRAVGRDAVRAVAWQDGLAEATRDFEASVAPVALPEGRGVLISARDVTARRTAERAKSQALAEVRKALGEREVLLKEIHHRVKNNLQIVSSLLSMQANREASSEVRAALGESVHRVRSMSLIHQKPYGSDDLARVELGGYVRTLATELCGALAPTARLEFDTEATELEAEQAVPRGLILNELVVNALKHGRDARGDCVVRIAIGHEGDRVRIAVSDEGPGMPAGFDFARLRQTTSLGMRLLAALLRQLGATLRIDPGPGARFVIHLPSTPRTTSTSVRPVPAPS